MSVVISQFALYLLVHIWEMILLWAHKWCTIDHLSKRHRLKFISYNFLREIFFKCTEFHYLVKRENDSHVTTACWFSKKYVQYKEENGNFLAFHVIKYWITILLLMLLSKENHKGQKWINTLNDQSTNREELDWFFMVHILEDNLV